MSENMGSTRSCPTILRAYNRHASTSSRSNHGYPSRMDSIVSPAASIPKTCSTASLRPRIIGFPPNIFGLIVILFRELVSDMSETSFRGQYTTHRVFESRIVGFFGEPSSHTTCEDNSFHLGILNVMRMEERKSLRWCLAYVRP